MGYADISIRGSDSAADCHSNAVGVMIEVFKQELLDPGNKFNTSGAVNVALFFEEIILPSLEAWASFIYDSDDEMLLLAQNTLTELESKNIAIAEQKDRWETEKNRLWHLGRFRELQQVLVKFIDFVKKGFGD